MVIVLYHCNQKKRCDYLSHFFFDLGAALLVATCAHIELENSSCHKIVTKAVEIRGPNIGKVGH